MIMVNKLKDNDAIKKPIVFIILLQKSIDQNPESNPWGLLFNVRAHYKLSYPDRIQFCYVNSEFILIPRLSYCVCVCCVRRAGVVHVRM